ncbi:hypothetical protein HDV00_010244 [Rhizophlyctis rosea]|nr:hypothetical protein HDV00_010244 [Rhizophlyctis rosea]
MGAYERPGPPILLRLGKLQFELFDLLFLVWQGVMLALYATKVRYAEEITSMGDERGVLNEYGAYSGSEDGDYYPSLKRGMPWFWVQGLDFAAIWLPSQVW